MDALGDAMAAMDRHKDEALVVEEVVGLLHSLSKHAANRVRGTGCCGAGRTFELTSAPSLQWLLQGPRLAPGALRCP